MLQVFDGGAVNQLPACHSAATPGPRTGHMARHRPRFDHDAAVTNESALANQSSSTPPVTQNDKGSACMVEAHARVALHALRQPAQAA